MKRYIILILVIVTIFVIINNAHSMLINLNEEQVQEAINLGRSYTHDILGLAISTSSMRIVGLDIIILATPFRTIAVYALTSERDNLPFDMDHIRKTAKGKEIIISHSAFGNRTDFAENYKMVIKQGNLTYKPFYRAMEHSRYIRTYAYKLFGKEKLVNLYDTSIYYAFSTDKIDPNGKITVIIDKGDVVKEVEFDLSKYK